jgi:hypothetical protein
MTLASFHSYGSETRLTVKLLRIPICSRLHLRNGQTWSMMYKQTWLLTTFVLSTRLRYAWYPYSVTVSAAALSEYRYQAQLQV